MTDWQNFTNEIFVKMNCFFKIKSCIKKNLYTFAIQNINKNQNNFEEENEFIEF
jgi:hypothetical protein